MKTYKTPKHKRSNLEQTFRNYAAENWRISRDLEPKKGHFHGKFTAFRIAAEAVALRQEMEDIEKLCTLS